MSEIEIDREMVKRAAEAYEENRMGLPITNALIASGLPARVAELEGALKLL